MSQKDLADKIGVSKQTIFVMGKWLRFQFIDDMM
nr:helix-turn-helix transcriptional regulator [Carnobacterium maltaromaticum]